MIDISVVEPIFFAALEKPSAEERAECLAYLGRSAPRPADRARADLVHVLFNHNDFVTVR